MINISKVYSLLNANADSEIFRFQGELSIDTMNSIFDTVETEIRKAGLPTKYRKKLYNILIEGVQNVYHHSENVEQIKGYNPVVLLFICEQKYHVVFGNTAQVNHANTLKKKLDKINLMTRQEKIDYYRNILDDGIQTSKGGSGLGMIDMARKSGNKLNLFNQKVNDELTFILLHIIV